MTPIVSVVIPTYNRARDLERALASVRAQTFPDWEALVVDNHSTDDTDAVIAKLADPRITLHKIHNRGVIAASRNLGIARARGEFVAFLDSDDWWMPEKLDASVAALRLGADIVYHDLFSVKRAGQKWFWRRARTRRMTSPVFNDLVEKGNGLATSGVVIRTTLMREIGGFTEDAAMVAMEDYDAWIRASRLTERFVKIPRVLGYYWEGGGNVSSAARTLGLLDQFDVRYGAPYRASHPGVDPQWVYYDRGRSYFRTGDLERARASLRHIHLRRVPPVVAAKTLITLLQIAIRKRA